MPAKKAENQSDGFSAPERAAMKERAAELRAEGKEGAKRAERLQAVLDRIEQMAPRDRVLAERVQVTVTATTPELSPKTW
jgi:Mg2+/Co2+ transporter CorB